MNRDAALQKIDELCKLDENKKGGCFWVYTGSLNLRMRWGECTKECASLHDCKVYNLPQDSSDREVG